MILKEVEIRYGFLFLYIFVFVVDGFIVVNVKDTFF